jgi:YVTN family beta-propeller protein
MTSRFSLMLLATTLFGVALAEPTAGLRRPIALAFGDGGKQLFVANQSSGTISVIDTAARQVTGEFKIGARLSDLLVIPGTERVLAADEGSDALVLCSIERRKVSVLHSLPLGAAPVSLQLSKDGSMCFVALLWTRAVAFVQVTTREPPLKLLATVGLPFAPRKQLVTGSKLIVADSFGGSLAVIDIESRKLDSVRQLPAHNIRGLALSSDRTRLYLAHQTLSPLAQTTIDDIRWGNLIGNHLRSLGLQNVLDPEANLLNESELYSLGELENGFGDPSTIAVNENGKVLIASSGTGQFAQADETTFNFSRYELGRRLTAVALGSDQKHLYATDAASDQVVVATASAGNVITRIPLGPQRALQPAETGEDLFYNARLSHNRWLSCHSCHTDGHSNELLSDTLGDGAFGAPKRVLSLLGSRDTGPWGWNGSAATLEAQIHKSIETTMRGARPSEDQVAALAAYLRSLQPPPGRGIAPLSPAQQAAVHRGEQVFKSQGCAKCHEPPSYTTARIYDVPLADEAGHTRFNPPSLRGISQRGAFFHDNRARSLAAVFNDTKHGLTESLPAHSLADLIAFLETL